ncbi:MAG TPA: hypothetical protein DDZ34_09860 [Syntrophaceae bacterium]|nr:hypothetical protein [Syntrophaceae bacterium]
MRCLSLLLFVILTLISGCGKDVNKTTSWDVPKGYTRADFDIAGDLRECQQLTPKDKNKDLATMLTDHVGNCMRNKGYTSEYSAEERSLFVKEYSKDILQILFEEGVRTGSEAWGASIRGEDWPNY